MKLQFSNNLLKAQGNRLKSAFIPRSCPCYLFNQLSKKQRLFSFRLAFLEKRICKIAEKLRWQKEIRLVQFLGFETEDFMAVKASCHNYLKAVQYVKACLSVSPLLCMVTSDLTDRNQSILCHSPFPFILCIVGK